MLNNNNHKSSCKFSSEVVSYLYDETGEEGRTKFESHLAGCVVCTDEFAAISNARFSVFEWQKEEFADLPTPEINIPYASSEPRTEAFESAGFFADLRGLFSISKWPVTAAAALAVCLGLGFWAMTYFGRSDQQAVAINNVDDRSVVPIVTPMESVETGSEDILPSMNSTTGRHVRLVKAVEENRRTRPDRQMTAGTRKLVNNVAERNSTRRASKAPVLSGFEDDDDNSLRLSALFDEIGSML